MRVSVVGIVLASVLAFTGLASGAASFADSTGDDNASPDITSVTVSEPVAGTLSVAVAVGNYQTLPTESWFNLWFDLDRNPNTGDSGDEALVRFLSEGGVEHYLWNGSQMVEAPATGMTGAFSAGVATVTIPKTGAFAVSTLGILAVSARGQTLAGDTYITSDFAPNAGRSPWTSPTGTFPDATNDHGAVPDIARVRVTDAKNGWIRFEVATPNRQALTPESAILLTIDADNKTRTGSGGADLSLTDVGGQLALERWNATRRAWRPDTAPTRVRERSRANLVVVEIHRSELGSNPRFGFKVASVLVDLVVGEAMGFDFAPDNLSWWRYKLANPAAVRLLAGRVVGTPARPLVGAPFTISVPVRRSDTNQAITSGSVTCNVLVAGKRVRAQGRFRAGKAQCSLRIPSTGGTVSGSVIVRSGGATVTSRFSFRVPRVRPLPG
jgi:hypothetical protein